MQIEQSELQRCFAEYKEQKDFVTVMTYFLMLEWIIDLCLHVMITKQFK